MSITVGYDHAGDPHALAALALCAKMGWPGDLVRGGRPDLCGDVFVFAGEEVVRNPTPSYAEQETARKAKGGAS